MLRSRARLFGKQLIVRRVAACMLAVVLALSITTTGSASWDRTKPPQSTTWQSIWLRDNWTALQRSVGGVNLLADNEYLIWPSGDALAPSHWVLAGASAAVLRTGPGLSDTNRKWGTWAARIVAGGGAVASLSQRLMTTTSYDDGFDGLHFSAGAYVRATAGAACKIGFSDGATTTYSTPHAGGSVWSWLEVTHNVSASATNVTFLLEAAISQTCHISGPTVIIGEVPPLYPQPSLVTHTELTPCFLAGSQTATARKVQCDRHMGRPWRLESAIISFTSGPLPSTTVTVDINHYDGSVFQSAFASGKPAGTTAMSAVAVPNGTYRYRCFGAANAASQTDTLMTVDVDAIGTPNPGVDMTVSFRVLYFQRPLESFLGATEVN